MSSRYSRPHTPPGPPPSQGSRKSSGRKIPSSSVSSKAPPSRSYDDHHNYDKTYTKSSSSSSSYPPPKTYSDDKYKSSSVRKVTSEKVPNNSSSSSGGNKYPGKGDTYTSEGSREYKGTREVHYPSGDRYNSKDPHLHHHPFLGSSYPGEKTRYSDKYLADSSPPAPYGDTKYAGKKYADNYDPYPLEKSTGRYSSASLRHEGSAYYSSGSLAPYGPFSSYSSYGAYGSTYGSRGGTGGYGTTDKLNYESDKLTQSSYSGLDKLSQVPVHPRDKLSSGGYSDTKLGPRSRLYPEETRRPYRDYTPPPTCSGSRSPMRGVSSSSYSNYGHYSPPPRSPQRQYLNRYVIGDSVVYGPPGHYPRDLRSSSPRIRPPSPPSPQPLLPRSYSRYPASPRRYPSSSNRRTPPTSSSQYRSPSPTARRAASPRRPPSPPPRRPPSPRSPQLRSSYRGSHEQSFERARSKDRYVSKGSAVRSPTRDSRGTTINRSELNSRGDRDKRKEPERRLAGSREKTHDVEPSKRARTGERNSEYHYSGSRGWGSKETTAASSNHLSCSQKDRRPRSPPPTSRNSVRSADMSRDRRREDSREREKSRRIEDRLGPSPSQTSRRSPTLRSRATRRAGSPRDKRSSSRRHPDLRLWIESRKSEGGKRLASPSSRARPVTKRVARSSERSTVTKRTRLGDPKRRLGGYKTRRRALPLKRNKILKKYQRLTAKRGANKASSSSAKFSSRENGGSRGDGGDEGSKGREDGGGGGDGSRPPGSSATIRRVIKKPKVLSLVNRMVLKPRVIRKPTQKLLKDPKEDMKVKEKTHTESQLSTRNANKSDEKQSTSSSTGATITNSTSASSTSTAATATTLTSSAFESSKRSSRSTTAPTNTTGTTTTSSS